MLIEWINHASFLLHHGNVRLLCDPWIEGYVFDNSWSLVSPTKFSYQDFGRVTHLWFSHEHPDHFLPPNLKSIPSEIRQRITVLFQSTQDKRVVNFCRDLGFREVIELDAKWLPLADDLHIYCQGVDRGDSWLALKSAERCILNLNDCIYLAEKDLLPVKKEVGPVDVLITQFSYASWWGNPSEHAKWQAAAQETLDKIARELTILEPSAVILAASFVYFCHQENEYMNEHINCVDSAYRFVERIGNARPIALYPGDRWNIGDSWDSTAALSRYSQDYALALRNPVRVETKPVELARLQQETRVFVNTLRRKNSAILLRRLPQVTIYLTDHKLSVKLSLSGLALLRRPPAMHDIALSSAALSYCFSFPWGGETLMINGRFQAPAHGDHHKFFRWFSIAQANSRSNYYDRKYYQTALKNKLMKLCSKRPRGPQTASALAHP